MKGTKKEKKIEIGYQPITDIDFGMISKECRKGTLKVTQSFWEKYVELRFEFECMHELLVKRIPLLKRKKLFEKK